MIFKSVSLSQKQCLFFFKGTNNTFCVICIDISLLKFSEDEEEDFSQGAEDFVKAAKQRRTERHDKGYAVQ